MGLSKLQEAERRKAWRRRQFSECGKCDYCNSNLVSFRFATVDHIKPMSRGGMDAPHNWALVCFPCNQTKADKELWEAGLVLQRRRTLIQGDITRYVTSKVERINANGKPDTRCLNFSKSRKRAERKVRRSRLDELREDDA